MTDGGAAAPGDPVAIHRGEEFKALRREIEYLDQRIEKSQYTMLLVNAVALIGLYVPVKVKVPFFEAQTSDATIASLGFVVAFGLFLLNAIVSAKYVSQGRHIDTIGAYLARLEDSIYGDAHPRLGWERMMRRKGELAPAGVAVKGRTTEALRRYGIWFFLTAASFVAFLDKGFAPWLAQGAP